MILNRQNHNLSVKVSLHRRISCGIDRHALGSFRRARFRRSRAAGFDSTLLFRGFFGGVFNFAQLFLHVRLNQFTNFNYVRMFFRL